MDNVVFHALEQWFVSQLKAEASERGAIFMRVATEQIV
jgi:hypothetical protein